MSTACNERVTTGLGENNVPEEACITFPLLREGESGSVGVQLMLPLSEGEYGHEVQLGGGAFSPGGGPRGVGSELSLVSPAIVAMSLIERMDGNGFEGAWMASQPACNARDACCGSAAQPCQSG